MTLSLAAVFIPILFMAGILGRLFREFAVTICTAILISGHGLRQPDADAVQPLPARAPSTRSTASSTAPWKSVFNGMLHVYGVTLRWVLRHRPVMLAMFVAVLVRHRLPLHRRAQGLHPGHRQRQFQRQHRSRAGHLVLPDGEVPAAGLARSWCRIRTSRRSTRAPAAGFGGASGAPAA